MKPFHRAYVILATLVTSVNCFAPGPNRKAVAAASLARKAPSPSKGRPADESSSFTTQTTRSYRTSALDRVFFENSDNMNGEGNQANIYKRESVIMRSFNNNYNNFNNNNDFNNFNNFNDDDPFFDVRNIPSFLGAQSLLILIAVVSAAILHTPKYGLGPGFKITSKAVMDGALAVVPMALLALILDKIEPYSRDLQDVSRATQRSILSILGGRFKPLIGLATAIMLGVVAGVGEEMLFRGVIQEQLTKSLGNEDLSLVLTSVIFGLGHAVTPLYAFIAGIASLFFGSLYIYAKHNLVVPMVCHGIYDVGALFWAHYNVTTLPEYEQRDLLNDRW
mmetsp:Transcript_22988/g.35440  ORF Transcript_22988/g.35440 Transcript_22988/m.35440 type:complete len:335 (-) Transcript_22988:249-1253(-)|eukprot:CAMPEP_0196816866 /NCGR_PEP_ID=MMETSP1362-20130617/57412_1 /TAXON_ID=163516 /ORGANISM="Leptocylindrus danicus, Strain CCMP1856" /LENGTH=334 /DNA_ID=CAMNT_0042194339 /DNA_START=60 /DNA_END=1064 /DNA_ORIENTATION=+